MAKLCLIDGTGFIYRLFHALPSLTTPDNIPVGAVFGFTKELISLKKNPNISHILVLFDTSRINFRQDIYKDYKANRSDPPENLIPQFTLVREATQACNIDYLEMEGYEADDLIAAYVKMAKDLDMDIEIISSDKDLMQLVDDANNIYMYDPIKKKKITSAEVQEKFGVLPNLVAQAQALIGDSSDNIPGVKGIGPKTAAELLNTYHSLDGIYENIEDITRATVKNNLQEYKDNAYMSLQLATLNCDVKNLAPIDNFQAKPVDPNKLLTFLQKLSFTSLATKIATEYKITLDTLTNKSELNIQHSTENNYFNNIQRSLVNKEINNKESLSYLHKALQDCHSLAIIVNFNKKQLQGLEIFAPATNETFTINLSNQIQESFLEPLSTDFTLNEVCLALKDIFTNSSINKIFYNAKPFFHILDHLNISLVSFDDVMLKAYLLNGVVPSHSQDITYLLQQNFLLEGDAQGYNVRALDIYNLNTIYTKQLIEQKSHNLYISYDKPFIKVLLAMEEVGILIDKAVLQNLATEYAEAIEILENKIYSLAGEEFNIGSPKQIGHLLFEKKGYKGKKNPSGSWKTDTTSLEELDDADALELTALILKWRQLAKLQSTYTIPLINQINKDTGRVHTTFLQTSTSTSRLSSTEPNLQNIPIKSEEGKQIRKAFIAKKGYKILSLDYSQIELRIFASIAQVKNLLEAFINNEDIHQKTAAEIFNVSLEEVTPNQRRGAKAINFGIIYGQTEVGLAKVLGTSIATADQYIKAYYATYPEISQYMQDTIAIAEKYGYVQTVIGRKCFIKDINSNNFTLRSFAKRAAINAPIQGSAADIVKIAMLNIDKYFIQNNIDAHILLQIHDEIIIEVPAVQAQDIASVVKTLMENVLKDLKHTFINMHNDLVVEYNIADNWLEAH